MSTPTLPRAPFDPAPRSGNTERLVTALREAGPSSQAQLARRLGLSPATVSGIVRTLREDGLVRVDAVDRRQSQISLVPRIGTVVAVEVTAASVRAVALDFAAAARHERAWLAAPTADAEPGDLGPGREAPTVGPHDVVRVVTDLLSQPGIRRDEVACLAVSIQGPVSGRTGALVSWARSQLPLWRDVPIAAHLQEALGLPVLVENDANAAALAEWTWGAGRGSSGFLHVLASAGVGGGLVLDGKIYHGSDGLAGEVGHVVVDHGGPVCFCGSRGCVTTYVSERSVLAALEPSGQTRTHLADVVAGALDGDPACQAVLWEAARYLGRALASTAKVVSPSVIAVGGVLGQARPLLFDALTSSTEMASLRAVSPELVVLPAVLEPQDATLLGCLALALEAMGQGVSELPGWVLGASEA